MKKLVEICDWIDFKGEKIANIIANSPYTSRIFFLLLSCTIIFLIITGVISFKKKFPFIIWKWN